MSVQLGNMVTDSVQETGPLRFCSTAFEEAWKE